MGKGGHNTNNENNDNNDNKKMNAKSSLTSSHRLPTLSEIKIKLPAHCFQPTVGQSMIYVVKDIIYVALTFILMNQIRQRFNYGFLFFPIYWYIQGLFI